MRVAAALALCGVLCTAPALHAQGVQNGDTLRIGLVLGDSAGWTREMRSAAQGVRLGVDEAQHAAALFGRALVLAQGADAARLVREARVQALLGGFSPEECGRLAAAAQQLGVLYLDVGCGADALRGPGCTPAMLHIAPSEAMLRDAAGGDTAVRVAAWDAGLERFGADQLNQRYRARFGEGMDSQAWAGWFAVKLLWESSLRARSAAPGALLAWLRSPAAQFDGHKGRALSIRAWDGQLRQPLYRLAPGGAEAEEVPRAAPGTEVSSQELLDRLGTPAAATTCRLDG